MYSALGELNRPDRKIITAEDPVEYYLPGINQVEVKSHIGLNFARIIRAMLRQAPNVILVGEIRDTETADMAIQASLTGRLVFNGTLSTNDAPSSITRLIDMGVQPFLVASSVMAIMAQRLVRLNCPKCSGPTTPDPSELQYLEVTPEQIATATFKVGKGCAYCQHTGYRGLKQMLSSSDHDIRHSAKMTFWGETDAKHPPASPDDGHENHRPGCVREGPQRNYVSRRGSHAASGRALILPRDCFEGPRLPRSTAWFSSCSEDLPVEIPCRSGGLSYAKTGSSYSPREGSAALPEIDAEIKH